MDPFNLKKLVLGAGWVIGRLPGRSHDESSPQHQSRAPGAAKAEAQLSDKPADPEPIEVLPEYELARDLVKNQFPLLIVTGGAGTGKSTFIRWLAQSFEGHVLIAAPTGVAAINVDGKTLHSLCVLPPAWILDEDIKEFKPSIARGARLLIIDEVSMVNANLLDGVSAFFKKNRGVDKPFGGLPVVLVGDLFQLPPVVPTNLRELFARGYKTAKFHGANALADCPYYAIELKKAFRQVDQTFVDLLANVREGRDLERTLSGLNAGCTITADPPEGAVWLSPRNVEVDRRNAAKLAELSGPSRQYEGVLSGKFKADRLPAPMVVELREGAQVMFTKNGNKWVNGSIGTVVKALDTKVHVRLHEDGEVVEVSPAQWEQYDYQFNVGTQQVQRVIAGTYSQIPLILAWSITIHKSQGKTIDRVHIDLGAGAFESGQTYVALSRCRSLQRLTLSRPLTPSDVRVDVESQAFYRALRELISQTPPQMIRQQMRASQSS
jgi:ATP-dependent exoDNAse (exonuclease V) alpha subunit